MVKTISMILVTAVCVTATAFSDGVPLSTERFTYSETFENGGLNGWESYPLWQDTACDPWIRANTIVPGDSNLCLEQAVNAFWNADTYGGMQRRLDMFLTPDIRIRFRYYIASATPAEFVKIRLAAGPDGALEYTVAAPTLNRWEWVEIDRPAITRENFRIGGREDVRLTGIAVLVKFPMANPRMKYYFGIDDVTVSGEQPVAFRFMEPRVYRLREWKPAISDHHYRQGDRFGLKGEWPLDADRVTVTVTSFTDSTRTVLRRPLALKNGVWSLAPFSLDWPRGMYRAVLSAWKGKNLRACDECMIFISPGTIGGTHPRVWFDEEKKKRVLARLESGEFDTVAYDVGVAAKKIRDSLPLDRVVYVFDQYDPDTFLEGTLYTPWFTQLYNWQDAVYQNALAYCFLGDREAGDYARQVLLTVSGFPSWQHPWIVKMGWHSYFVVSLTGKFFSLAYDMIYDLMNERERAVVRSALMEKVVVPCHRGYVEQNRIASNTSNWIAMIVGGSLTSMASIYDDGPETPRIEPYFTGAVLKLADMIDKSVDPTGSYGEGGYFKVSFREWSDTLPGLENVFNIDLSAGVRDVWSEVLWSAILPEKRQFQTGDSGGFGVTSGPYFVEKFKDPILGWAYNYLKSGDILKDILYDTGSSPRKDPYGEEPVRCFKNTGITVFKSGWGKDDFVFVMQTGSFYNHQHYHQGNFFLADRGSVFIDRRSGSHYWYYSFDPLYLPWFIQPVGYSTILLDGNRQSQRAGDPIGYIPGFEDRAFIHQFLNGRDAAFVSGDMTRLYWGKAASLRRNVLYLKPRTVLMLDTVTPGARDIDATLLYQAVNLDDIEADERISRVTKGDNTLHIMHLNPDKSRVAAEEVPHYIFTVKDTDTPLTREGMLTLTARTAGTPLVIANLLTSTAEGEPAVNTERHEGFVTGTVSETPFAFSVTPGKPYEALGVTTDALAVTGNGDRLFCALATVVEKNGATLFRAAEPVTVELVPGRANLSLAGAMTVTLGVPAKPARMTVNGKKSAFAYDASKSTVSVELGAGEWVVDVR